MPVNERQAGLRRDSKTGESTHADPAELREQIRMQKLAQIETDSSVKGMSNAHYAAQMANAGQQYTSEGRNYNNEENNNSGDPQVTYASLKHLHGPTKRSTEANNSRETLYAPISHVVHGPRKQSAFRGQLPKKSTGGARKKTRKHKKESRTKSKSRKLRKARK